MLILVETRVGGMKVERVIKNIGFPKSHRVEACNFAGGIWIMWKEEINVTVLVNHFQFVHMEVKVPELQNSLLVTGVYGSSNQTERKALWLELSVVVQSVCFTMGCCWGF